MSEKKLFFYNWVCYQSNEGDQQTKILKARKRIKILLNWHYVFFYTQKKNLKLQKVQGLSNILKVVHLSIMFQSKDTAKLKFYDLPILIKYISC